MPIVAPVPPAAMADGLYFRGQEVSAMNREELLGVVGYYMQKHIKNEDRARTWLEERERSQPCCNERLNYYICEA